MESYQLEQVQKDAEVSGKRYFEFLRVPALSLGIYNLAAKSQDPQGPHKQDEVYHVLAGRAHIEVEGERQTVQAGSIIYVAAHAKHSFVDITEDLHVLVFFAPAEED